jgi:hypothetical protein
VIDLIDGIKHKDSGEVFKKHLKRVPVLALALVGGVLMGRVYRGVPDLFEVTADNVGMLAGMLLLWLVDMLRGISDLSPIHNRTGEGGE